MTPKRMLAQGFGHTSIPYRRAAAAAYTTATFSPSYSLSLLSASSASSLSLSSSLKLKLSRQAFFSRTSLSDGSRTSQSLTIARTQSFGTARAMRPSEAPTQATESFRTTPSTSKATPHPKHQVHIALLGAPGVGKGTYARHIGPYFSIPFISTGDLIRDEIKRQTPLGKQIAAATSIGSLLDDSIVLQLLQKRLAQPDCANGYLLDGYPRRVSQAEQLSNLFSLDLVVNLQLRSDILIQKITSRRVCNSCGENYNLANIDEDEYHMPPLLPKVHGKCDKCSGELVQREDDNVATVTHRLKVYEDETFPLVDYYTKKKTLVTFNVKKGLDDVPELLEMINKEVNKRVSN